MKHSKNYSLDKNTLLFFIGAISTLLGLIFLFFFTISKPGDFIYSITKGNNLYSYGITLLICVLLFFIFSLILKKPLLGMDSIRPKLISRNISFSMIIIFLVVSALLLLDLFFKNEDQLAGYATIFPKWFSFFICIIAILISYAIILTKKGHTQSNNIILYLLYFLLASLNAIRYANINVFGTFYSLYHCNAVTSSIHNVHYNTPFNILTSGIYGHYAIFLKLPLIIFGNSPLVIGIIIGVIGFISCALTFAAIHIVLTSDFIKALSAISLVFLTNIVSETYWQTMPIRWIFPSIILFLIALYVKKNTVLSFKHIILGCFFCSLSILWETETGFFCAITWATFCTLRSLQINGISFKKLFFLAFIHIFLILLETVFAILIMNIYNLSVGGTIEISSFFFPLNTGFSEKLSFPLTFKNQYYVYVILNFMCCLLWALTKTPFCYNKTSNSKACFVASTSILGFAMLSYYINRPPCGPNNAYIQIIICISLLADAMVNPLKDLLQKNRISIYNTFKICIGSVSFFVLVLLTLLSSFTTSAFLKRFDQGLYDYKSLVDFANEVSETVPKNTYAIGLGADEIYSILGWNTQYRLRDVADLDSGNCQELLPTIHQEISNQNAIFTCDYNFVTPNFNLVKEFIYKDIKYGYFVK